MASTLKKIEFLFVFLVLPSVIFFFNSTVIAFSILYLIFFTSVLILYNDKDFSFYSLKKKIDWKFVLIFSFIFLILGFFYTLILDENLLFNFPKSNIKLWLVVIFMYPFLSVIPQEIVYRVFFFQRFFPKKNKMVFSILINLVFFSYGHLIFYNIHAILITAIVSPIFAYAYLQKSFLTCIILHSLGGQIIFTLGLGKFFY